MFVMQSLLETKKEKIQVTVSLFHSLVYVRASFLESQFALSTLQVFIMVRHIEQVDLQIKINFRFPPHLEDFTALRKYYLPLEQGVVRLK